MVFANSVNFEFQQVHRVRMGLPRVSAYLHQMRGKEPIHYFKAILDQFILRPLARLGISSYHHLQTRQVRHLTSQTVFKFCSNPFLFSCLLNLSLLSLFLFDTVRLWSTKLNANLVCYKGHNYPVWDVQVCEFVNSHL